MRERERERRDRNFWWAAGKISSAISRAIIYNRVLVNTRTLASAANRPPFLRQLPMHKRTVNVAPPFLRQTSISTARGQFDSSRDRNSSSS